MIHPSFPIDKGLRRELMEHLIDILHQRCKDIPGTQLYVLAFSFDRFAQIKSSTLQVYIQHYQQKFESYNATLPHMALPYMHPSFLTNSSSQHVKSPIAGPFATNITFSTPSPSSSSSTPSSIDFQSASAFQDTHFKQRLPFPQPLSFSSSFQDPSPYSSFVNPSIETRSSFFPIPSNTESIHKEPPSESYLEGEDCSASYNSNYTDQFFFFNDHDLTFPTEAVFPTSPFMQNEDSSAFLLIP
ncbi:hypothetical protein SPOG_02032 [Schizosaccharomyces cryophilus OY26]|uniref:Uncharacterized protein n=1 Tax=Schizosaccharomyces cryophilus (strain OY26 / ATCC MYA-4695 / CBS 11777 / NBRC 106824 / NRRL Y48691) TaxID=653667 RepID=S9X6I6_SCHCR|nr:uncharacterized protein SPOG_02032 [Schizosaccharomyces cryophilus OY26]EPY52712.1 hypothetical protein SPOG_02032 [Schizosaccharomyces cryophilus OY26]